MLRVGTDCSGIEAPIQALEQLKIPYIHEFSSEIDKYCIKSIKANYNPKIIFGDKDGSFPDGDIRNRNIKDVPDIDLYVCGFPCQPFSSAGHRKGLEDDRGNVFFSCLELIEKKQPKYFILENVKGLKTHDKGKTWKIIWESLLGLERYGYIIKWKILNTRDYGIPQNRERIFIVGYKEKDFEWPEKIKMNKIENYIDWEDNNISEIPTRMLKNNIMNKLPNNSIFIDLSFPKHSFPNSNIYSLCITADSRLWCIPKKRFANVKEYLKLQGFELNFKIVVSKTRIKKQLGNSISINVLKCLFNSILK
jgi:DNA (cytosine-5)-methyltransferase 1